MNVELWLKIIEKVEPWNNSALERYFISVKKQQLFLQHVYGRIGLCLDNAYL